MKKQPNIIFMLSDQHNYKVSGFMGDNQVLTPNLDNLAKHGVTFSECYCNSPLCVPSRASMLSGLLPSKTGIYNNMQCLPTDRATFVHSLSVAGYDTVLAGRMHFSGYDQRHGFEKRLVGDITASFAGIDNELEMYEVLRGTSYQSRIGVEKSGYGSSAVLKFDNAVTDAACEYISQRADERPLFIIVGWYAPHCPYVADKELYDYYYNLLPVPEVLTPIDKMQLHPAIRKWINLRGLDDITNEELRRVRAAYYALVTFMDRNAGRVMNAVEQSLDMDNTVVIYGSDHGDNIGEHGLFWKTNFYEGSSRVPFTMSWRNRFKENVWLDGPTCLLDLAPTLLELAGAEELPVMDGMSLVDSLKTGKPINAERAIISQLGDIKGDEPSAMIRKGDYKLVMHYGYNDPQLFNLVNDPDELNDLGTDPLYVEISQALRKELLENWDADKAKADLVIAIKHHKMIKKWINNVGWAPLEEWKTTKGDNYYHTS